MANRVLIGKDLAGVMKFRVSLPGKDVRSLSLPPSDFAIDSSWNDSLKLYTSGVSSVTFPKNSSNTYPPGIQLASFPSLGYVPVALVYIFQVGSGGAPDPSLLFYNQAVRFDISETTLKAAYTQVLSSSFTGYFNYYIFKVKVDG